MDTPLKIPASALNNAVQALGMMSGYLKRQSESTTQGVLISQAFANLSAMYEKSRLDIADALAAPKEPVPEEGWRFLEVGEDIKPDDEVYEVVRKEWTNVRGLGLIGGTVSVCSRYRRRTSNPDIT